MTLPDTEKTSLIKKWRTSFAKKSQASQVIVADKIEKATVNTPSNLDPTRINRKAEGAAYEAQSVAYQAAAHSAAKAHDSVNEIFHSEKSKDEKKDAYAASHTTQRITMETIVEVTKVIGKTALGLGVAALVLFHLKNQ